MLTDLLGYRSEEAARLLRIKPGTVRALSSQARAAMRQTLSEEP